MRSHRRSFFLRRRVCRLGVSGVDAPPLFDRLRFLKREPAVDVHVVSEQRELEPAGGQRRVGGGDGADHGQSQDELHGFGADDDVRKRARVVEDGLQIPGEQLGVIDRDLLRRAHVRVDDGRRERAGEEEAALHRQQSEERGRRAPGHDPLGPEPEGILLGVVLFNRRQLAELLRVAERGRLLRPLRVAFVSRQLLRQRRPDRAQRHRDGRLRVISGRVVSGR